MLTSNPDPRCLVGVIFIFSMYFGGDRGHICILYFFLHDNIYVCQLRRRGRVLFGGDGVHKSFFQYIDIYHGGDIGKKVFFIYFLDNIIHLSIPAATERKGAPWWRWRS